MGRGGRSPVATDRTDGRRVPGWVVLGGVFVGGAKALHPTREIDYLILFDRNCWISSIFRILFGNNVLIIFI